MPDNKRVLLAAWVSTVSNIFLTIIKIIVGFMFRSEVLIADGVHNGGDVIASAVALSSMRISNRPADEDHPYGHGKAEVVASAVVAVIMAIAAIVIAYNSVSALLHPAPKESMLVLMAAVVSLIWKQALYVYTIRAGTKGKSKGLIATAHDHLADVYASIAAVIGITVALFGQRYGIPYTAYADPVAGILVSGFVMKLAVQMGRESIGVLMEKNIAPQMMDNYVALVRSIPQVKRIDRIRAREHGHYILVDIRVGIPAYLSIQEGHDVSRRIKEAIMDKHPDVKEVLVHLNPWYGDQTN